MTPPAGSTKKKDGEAQQQAPPDSWEEERDGLNAQIAELTTAAEEKDKQLEELQAELEQRDATIVELQAELAAAPTTRADAPAVVLSGETRTVTYLGRPELIGRDEEGEPNEEDVYKGDDPWGEHRAIHLAVGESTQVSAEKAAQLANDFPDAFDVA